jgi:hypothetical protein
MTDLPIIPNIPSIAHVRAHQLARKAIEQRMRAQGLRITRYAVVVEQARIYQAEHQEELLAQAMETVRTCPWYRAIAERELRDQERQRRKSARAGAVENPTGRSVYPSDHDERAIDKSG